MNHGWQNGFAKRLDCGGFSAALLLGPEKAPLKSAHSKRWRDVKPGWRFVHLKRYSEGCHEK